MKPFNNISDLIANFKVNPRADKQDAILSDAIKLQKQRSSSPSAENKWKHIMKNNITKLATAAVILIALLLTFNHNGVSPDGATVAWADVVKQLNNHEKYKCRQRVIVDNGTDMPTMEVIHVNLSLRRQEVEDGTIHIIDMQNEDAIVVEMIPEKHKATVTKMLGYGPKKDPDIIDMVKRFDQESTERLGTKEVDGKKLYGFRHKPNEHNEFTVWVDTGTKLPVEIELRHPKMKNMIYMDNFEFDFEYDPADFSTKVPEGYEVETIINDYRPVEPKQISANEIQAGLNHTAYTIGKLPWVTDIMTVQTIDPLGSQAISYITALKTIDDNIILLIQGNYYDTGRMIWIFNQQLVLESGPEMKVYTHPNSKIYAKYFLESFAKDMPDFAEFELSDQRQTRMITMPDEVVIGVVANSPVTEEKLKDLVNSLAPVQSE